jgi:hypothetical protein
MNRGCPWLTAADRWLGHIGGHGRRGRTWRGRGGDSYQLDYRARPVLGDCLARCQGSEGAAAGWFIRQRVPWCWAILPDMNLTAETTRRLAFIRLLVARADEESRQPPPFSYDSINRFHDAAEMFLALAAQQHHLTIAHDLLGYWNIFEPILNRPLAYKAQMQKFNKVRVNLKHYGAEPAPTEVEHARTTVIALLADECPALFGIALDEVSLTVFVLSGDARALLESAEQNWTAGNEKEAFADLADSFETLIRITSSGRCLGTQRASSTPLRT